MVSMVEKQPDTASGRTILTPTILPEVCFAPYAPLEHVNVDTLPLLMKC